MIKGFETIQKGGQESLDLAMKNFGLMGQGMQAIAVEAADYSKKSFADGTAVLEKMMASKSVETVVQLQSEYVKTAYESYVGEMTKLGTMMTDLAKDYYKPFQGLFGVR